VDRTRLVRLDLTPGTETEVDSHPTLNLDTHYGGAAPLILSQKTDELIGVRYLGERQVIRPLDSHFAAVPANLETLSEGDLAAISSDDTGHDPRTRGTLPPRVPHPAGGNRAVRFADGSVGPRRTVGPRLLGV
jgi:hypothetical protein